MWEASQRYDVAWSGNEVVPEKILYEHDGPQVFTSHIGFINVIFLKVDETEDSDIYLVSQTDSTIISALYEGAISLRGALRHDYYWIVEVENGLVVRRHWECPRRELPAGFLPDKSVALRSYTKSAPNSYSQAKAFFGMGFDGDEISAAAMRYGIFRRIIDNAYDAARGILSPALLVGTKTSTFDFTIDQPEFGSLILAINDPIFDSQNLRRILREKSIDQHDFYGEFSSQRDLFFDAMDEIVDEANKGDLKPGLVEERFSLLDQIQNVIPTGESIIERAEFSSYRNGRTDSLVVQENAGERIFRAFKVAEMRPVVETGTIQIINARRNSFVMMSRRGKLVTCYVEPGIFRDMQENPSFKLGATIASRGYLMRRVQRDRLDVEGTPTLVAASTQPKSG
ncbi:hypothetical protein FJ950_10320 [Mesorhizobium sp. B2-3-14]|uniref:hypothetical protein n=1 Tax=Mesorhizobium sp. B2-3-14 TaxID=2589950 RepID=UPI00112E96A3|nr:hypothetical protein [Mesorhizobium sp. B2-3-14]TPL86787.1 hypothetical protein FJ950_10320 [Mesorhizobium sp. B2-3-14]